VQGREGNPSGNSGVQIDAGTVYFNWDSSTNTVSCLGQAVGPDANNLSYEEGTDVFNSSEAWCEVIGFPSLAVPVNVQPNYFNAFGGHEAPQPQVFDPRGHDEVGCDAPSGEYCLTIDVPISAVQNANDVSYDWEVMQTAPTAATSSAAIRRAGQRAAQAVRRAVARGRHA
jgi:hypothetical protein